MRIEVHIVKFKRHPIGKIRNCLECVEEVNNIEHVIYHCPVAKFVWDVTGDLIRIMTGVSINVNVRAALLNFYTIRKDMENKKKSLYINTLLVIAKRVIYTLSYRDEIVKNNIIVLN